MLRQRSQHRSLYEKRLFVYWERPGYCILRRPANISDWGVLFYVISMSALILTSHWALGIIAMVLSLPKYLWSNLALLLAGGGSTIAFGLVRLKEL